MPKLTKADWDSLKSPMAITFLIVWLLHIWLFAHEAGMTAALGYVAISAGYVAVKVRGHGR